MQTKIWCTPKLNNDDTTQLYWHYKPSKMEGRKEITGEKNEYRQT